MRTARHDPRSVRICRWFRRAPHGISEPIVGWLRRPFTARRVVESEATRREAQKLEKETAILQEDLRAARLAGSQRPDGVTITIRHILKAKPRPIRGNLC